MGGAEGGGCFGGGAVLISYILPRRFVCLGMPSRLCYNSFVCFVCFEYCVYADWLLYFRYCCRLDGGGGAGGGIRRAGDVSIEER